MTMSNTAVVVIDVQNAVLSVPGMLRPAETMANLDACVARIAGLLARARGSNIPIFFVQHDGTVGHRLQPGSVGGQIRPELTPRCNEPVVHKSERLISPHHVGRGPPFAENRQIDRCRLYDSVLCRYHGAAGGHARIRRHVNSGWTHDGRFSGPHIRTDYCPS